MGKVIYTHLYDMKEYQEILQLIKVSQFSEYSVNYMEDWDWNEIYSEATAQAIVGIIAGVIPKRIVDTDKRWQQILLRQKANYIQYCYAEKELNRVLTEVGIPFVILKGNASAIYYKHPEQRKMGDIDFIVLPCDYEKTKDILVQKGYIEKHEEPRHIGYKKDGFFFELHKCFSHDIDIDSYIMDGIKKRISGRVGEYEFPMLPSIANGLVLLDHMKYHLKTGMGLRQIIDWMMYVSRELSDDVWFNGFNMIVKEKGMYKFAITITKMCQIYLGLQKTITWCNSGDNELCKRLMQHVMVSGNFGKKLGDGYMFQLVSTRFQREGKIRYLQSIGENTWKAYKKHHWLKPFAWVYQLFRFIQHGLQTNRRRKISGDIQHSKERVRLLKELEI